MNIKYYLNEKGAYITPCPNEAIKSPLFPIMVGSPACQSCECFGREYMKTVDCLYKEQKNGEGKPK